MKCPECGGTDARDMGWTHQTHVLMCRTCPALYEEVTTVRVITDPAVLRAVMRLVPVPANGAAGKVRVRRKVRG